MLNPTTPESVDVLVSSTVSQDISEYHIDYFGVRKDPNDPTAVVCYLQWSCGYRDDAGTFHKVGGPTEPEAFEGTDVLTALGVLVANGGYGLLANATWGLLQGRGIVPAGNIT